jgi:hypothetical protein
VPTAEAIISDATIIAVSAIARSFSQCRHIIEPFRNHHTTTRHIAKTINGWDRV